MAKNFKIIVFSIVIGLFACAISIFAFSSPGSNQPPNGNPTFWLLNGTSMYYSGGSVGIGTTTPSSQLELTNTIASPGMGEAAGLGQLKLDNGVTALSSVGGIEFKVAGDSNGYGSKIQALNSGGSQLVFAGRQGTSTWSEYIRIAAGGNVGIGIATPGATLQVKGTMQIFGTRVDDSSNYGAQQAPSDGFVSAYLDVSDAGYCVYYANGYTDSSSNPTTIVAGATYQFTPSYSSRNYESFIMPVRKGDYWKVVPANSYGSCTVNSFKVYWTPLGT